MAETRLVVFALTGPTAAALLAPVISLGSDSLPAVAASMTIELSLFATVVTAVEVGGTNTATELLLSTATGGVGTSFWKLAVASNATGCWKLAVASNAAGCWKLAVVAAAEGGTSTPTELPLSAATGSVGAGCWKIFVACSAAVTAAATAAADNGCWKLTVASSAAFTASATAAAIGIGIGARAVLASSGLASMPAVALPRTPTRISAARH